MATTKIKIILNNKVQQYQVYIWVVQVVLKTLKRFVKINEHYVTHRA